MPPPPPVPPAPSEPPAPPEPPVPPPQEFAAEAEFRGLAAPLAKSALLLSVSVQPPPTRRAALVLSSVAVGPLPSKLLADEPYPTKSAMVAFGTHPVPQVSRV